MRLNNYLIKESMPEIRSKQLTEQEAIDIINKNCSNILQKYKKHPSWKIYRGLKLSPKFQFTNPSKGQPRRSKGEIGNYYTLLMDNLPNWKNYPKRSQSIICATSLFNAEGYGNVYIVFPFNNATFGVCPAIDIWLSFKSIGNLRIFVRDLKNMLKNTTNVSNQNFDKDWNKLTKSFKESEEFINSDKISNIIINKWRQHVKKWIVDISNGKSYIDVFNNRMDPTKNNFGLTKDPTNITKNRELWTDSKVVLVDKNYIDRIIR